MNTTLSLLLIILYSTNTQNVDYCIASQILKSLDQLDKLTVSSLNETCSTSTKTIQKFCKSLGFHSFSDFKSSLMATLNTRKSQIIHRISNTSQEKMLQNIQYISNNLLNQDEFQKSIDNIITSIYNASTIYIIGAAFPNALTISFQEDMNVMGKLTYCLQVNNNPQFPQFQDNDLIIMISLSGNFYKYGKECFEYLYKNHQKKIFLLSGYNEIQQPITENNFIRIPILEDNEDGNLLLLEILQYIKYLYFLKYIQEK